MPNETEWDKRLRRRAKAVTHAVEALEADVAAARLDGLTFRRIGEDADINHEKARTVAIRINGHSLTQAQRDAG